MRGFRHAGTSLGAGIRTLLLSGCNDGANGLDGANGIQQWVRDGRERRFHLHLDKFRPHLDSDRPQQDSTQTRTAHSAQSD